MMKQPNEVAFKDLEQVVCSYDKCVLRGDYWRCYFEGDKNPRDYKGCEIFKAYIRTIYEM